MKKTIFLIILTLLVMTGVVNAQFGGYTSLQYSMGFASGDMGSFISKPSFRGFLFEYRHNVTDNIAAGVELGWNVFYEKKDYGTYTIDNISLSGVQYRYTNEFPIIISADYYFRPGEDLNPYINFGIGTMYSLRNTDMGLYTYEQDAWHFAIKPEIGLMYYTSDRVGLKLAAKYYSGIYAGDLETQSYFSLNTGFVFLF